MNHESRIENNLVALTNFRLRKINPAELAWRDQGRLLDQDNIQTQIEVSRMREYSVQKRRPSIARFMVD